MYDVFSCGVFGYQFQVVLFNVFGIQFGVVFFVVDDIKFFGDVKGVVGFSFFFGVVV